MPRLISVDMEAHLQEPVQTLSLCWHITRADGQEYFCTSHSKDLTVDGDLYACGTSFMLSATETKSGLSVDNMEIRMPISASFTKADILAKLFYGASLDLFWVNWADLTMGKINEAVGWKFGEAKLGDISVAFDLASKSKLLEAQVLDLINPDCHYVFGLDDDIRSRCPAVINDYLVTGAVTAVVDRLIFEDTARTEATDIFACGKITFTSGNNSGYSMEVESFDPATDRLSLLFNLPYAFVIGDTYNLWRGCDRKAATCKTLGFFNDFGGKPNVPDMDTALQYAIKT